MLSTPGYCLSVMRTDVEVSLLLQVTVVVVVVFTVGGLHS